MIWFHALLLFGAGQLVQSAVYTEDVDSQRALWEGYKSAYDKSYDNKEEEERRFGFFVDNLKLADEHHEIAVASGIADHSRHGITEFFDLDLRNDFASIAPPINEITEHGNLRNLGSSSHDDDDNHDCDDHTTNEVVDWTNVLTDGRIYDAGGCRGSGWAFAVAAQVESDTVRLHGNQHKYSLSPQQLLHCVTSNNGCRGGRTEHAYNYLVTHNFETSSAYRYQSFSGITGGPCDYNAALGVARVTTYSNAYEGEEDCMANHVQNTGTLSVCVAATNAFYTYTGGILAERHCDKNGDTNHCLQAVGVYPVKKGNSGYWKLRNSKGFRFGDRGYIYLQYGRNTCNIRNNPTFATTAVDL